MIGKPFRNLDGRRVQTFYAGRCWLTFVGLRPKLQWVCRDNIVGTPWQIIRRWFM